MLSAVICAYHYDAVMKNLEIRYHSGEVYRYLNVSEKVFEEMRITIAKGIWFNRRIENKYPINEVMPGLNQSDLFDRYREPLSHLHLLVSDLRV